MCFCSSRDACGLGFSAELLLPLEGVPGYGSEIAMFLETILLCF